MAILDIVLYPDPILRETAEEITEFNDELKTLADNMVETMYQNRGIGLAGNQIGRAKRILVLDVSENQDQPTHFINPTITEAIGTASGPEGCLSIPGYRETVKRHERIEVEAFDCEGKSFKTTADGLLSVCLQHEIDHLNGVLFVDHLSMLKKQMFSKWFKKNAPLSVGTEED